ncbi:hypothetical protein D3C87_2096390 [compost metagenome]
MTKKLASMPLMRSILMPLTTVSPRRILACSASLRAAAPLEKDRQETRMAPVTARRRM